MTAAARPHRHRTLLAYAATTVALVTLGACSGGDPAPTVTTPPTGASSTSSTSTAAPTTTTSTLSTTTAGPSFPAGLPNAAKARTPQGAEAFVRYFLSALNRSWTQPNSQLLNGLCRFETSKSCTAFKKTATDLERKGQRYDGDPVSIASTRALSLIDQQQRVEFIGHQERRSVIDSSGKVVLTDPRELSHFMFYLSWSGTGWVVDDVKVVKS